MKERPILFSTPMVQAILDGRKTQTRRVVKPQPASDFVIAIHPNGHPAAILDNGHRKGFCPYGAVGDHLWVRETWAELIDSDSDDEPYFNYDKDDYQYFYAYKADGKVTEMWGNSDTDIVKVPVKWKPSIHMPRAASRILLEITGIRVERLHDISEKDAKAEGAPFELGQLEGMILGAKAKYRSGFVRLWQSINGTDSWDANPWVWVIEFKRVDGGAV